VGGYFEVIKTFQIDINKEFMSFSVNSSPFPLSKTIIPSGSTYIALIPLQ